MLKPLKIGNQVFPINIIQGPLAGVSSAPFRLLTWRCSQPAFTCTEMISCKTILYQSQFSQRFLQKYPTEGPVSYQLSSNNPHELAEATKRVTDQGATIIDLNCGCPVKKIRNKGAGSSLLTQLTLLYQLITAMKNNTHLPVSIKIRVEGNSEDKFNQEVAKVVSEAGADFLVVHGRHWTEHYETPCHYDDISFFVNEMQIPVIGNGDIQDKDSLLKMFATGCAGVMIGRAGVGQPWLIKNLVAELKQENISLPSNIETKNVFLEHITLLIELLGNERFAIFQARTIAKYYARQLQTRREFCEEIYKCENFFDFRNICDAYFT